mmetsp:Transcript_10374/g.22003  ORF Transcript_10374/g.22003 Transcript_10374/m.22003 type:complete len:143 (+) Transcript_10374:330-758(+)
MWSVSVWRHCHLRDNLQEIAANAEPPRATVASMPIVRHEPGRPLSRHVMMTVWESSGRSTNQEPLCETEGQSRSRTRPGMLRGQGGPGTSACGHLTGTPVTLVKRKHSELVSSLSSLGLKSSLATVSEPWSKPMARQSFVST